MVDLNCWLSSNVWLSRIELDIRRECREVCCEADEWPGLKTSGGQCTSILFFIFVLVFVCLYFSVVFVLAFVFIFGWVADWKRLEYESWNLTWDGMGFSLRMEVRWQDFKSICSTLRRRNREKSAPYKNKTQCQLCKRLGNQGVNLDGSHHPTHQPPSLLHPCGWNHWWWGEPARDDPRFRFHLSQYCSLLYIQKSASIVSTICSILYHQHCNTLPNSRDDDGCSQGELVEGCGKGEKRM